MRNNRGEISIIAVIVFIALLITGIVVTSKMYYIEPGNVGVLVYKAGQNAKGVDDKPLTPGRGFRELFSEDVVEYPVYLQTAIWTKSPTEGSTEDQSITANSKEGMAVNIDTTLSYTLEPAKIPDLYVKFRTGIGVIQATYIRQSVRQAIQDVFGSYSAEDIYWPKKQEIIGKIQASLVKKLGTDGINIQQYTINETRLPQQIIEAINAKMASSQNAGKAEQELRTIKIQAEQAVAKAKWDAEARVAAAKAEAEAIRISAEAIRSQGGVEYVNLKAIEKWDGKLPAQMIPGQTVPFINLNK